MPLRAGTCEGRCFLSALCCRQALAFCDAEGKDISADGLVLTPKELPRHSHPKFAKVCCPHRFVRRRSGIFIIAPEAIEAGGGRRYDIGPEGHLEP